MQTLQAFLLIAPVLLFSVIAHEIAHGYAALRQGDRTALDAGRLSWNPVRHIDPFLTILMPLVTFVGSHGTMAFGGAKPVPVDPRNYRHVRRGDIIVSLAGVATNVVIAVVCVLGVLLIGQLARAVPALGDTLGILQAMLIIGVEINAVLVAFNLLPIPPLDGSHVAKYLLPRPLAVKYVQFGRYGLLVLILLLSFGQKLLQLWLFPVLAGAERLLGLVGPFILTSALRWVQ